MQRDYEGCLRGDIPENPSFGLQIPSVLDPELAPGGKQAASAFAMYLPVVGTQKEQNAAADEMTERLIARVAQFAPNFPNIIERKLVYPSYTYELMFGATGGDFCHGLLQPEHMGPFRPGPTGWIGTPAFSPSGLALAYVNSPSPDGPFSIMRVPVGGGTPATIHIGIPSVPTDLDWDERDVLMYTQPDGIWEVPAAGGGTPVEGGSTWNPP